MNAPLRLRNQAGFSLIEMIICVALLAFVILATFMATSSLKAGSKTETDKMNAHSSAFMLLERFRSNFTILGSGWNKRQIGVTHMRMTQQRAVGNGKFANGDSVLYRTICQASSAPGFPRRLVGKKLKPIPSLCAGFVCGNGSRPIIEETLNKQGRVQVTKFPTKAGKSEDPAVAQALCFSPKPAYVEIEVWTARLDQSDNPVWERQSSVLPLSVSLTGNVNYIPLKD